MRLDFTEYGKEEENRELIKRSLKEKNKVFAYLLELYEEAVKNDDKTKAESLKGVIDGSIDRNVEEDEGPFAEPLATIYDELHKIKGTARCEFKISGETKKYLENHPEVRLYKVKVKETWTIRRSNDEVSSPTYYLFEKDDKEIKRRIERRQNYIHASSHYTPVRHISIEVLELEHLSLKSLDHLIE